MFRELLIKFMEINNLNQTDIALKIGDTPQAVSDFLAKKSNPRIKTKNKYFNKLVGFKDFYDKNLNILEIEEVTIPDTEIIPNKNGNEFIDLGGGLLFMKIPLLEINAQAGFADNYQDVEFLANIENYHYAIVKQVHKGKYLAFRVKGDSMDNGSSNSIVPNSIVTVRELQRHHWIDQLRYNKRPYWIIATTESRYPLLKQIIAHDTQKGIITCHSLNDAPEYSDFDLNLNEVTGLFYVTDISKNITD